MRCHLYCPQFEAQIHFEWIIRARIQNTRLFLISFCTCLVTWLIDKSIMTIQISNLIVEHFTLPWFEFYKGLSSLECLIRISFVSSHMFSWGVIFLDLLNTLALENPKWPHLNVFIVLSGNPLNSKTKIFIFTRFVFIHLTWIYILKSKIMSS